MGWQCGRIGKWTLLTLARRSSEAGLHVDFILATARDAQICSDFRSRPGFGKRDRTLLGVSWKAGMLRAEKQISHGIMNHLSSTVDDRCIGSLSQTSPQVNLAVCTYLAKLMSSLEGPPLSLNAWEYRCLRLLSGSIASSSESKSSSKSFAG